MRRLFLPVLYVCLLLASGCQKINFNQTLTIGKDDKYAEVEFKAPSKDRTVQVTAECNVPVNVYVVLMDNKAEAVTTLLEKKELRKKLASEVKTKDASFDAEVPAGKGFAVLIAPVEKPKEDLKVELKVKAR
jgi:hypothetical protein